MRLVSSALILALTTSAALASGAGMLSPGAPAGVKRAQMEGNTGLYVLLGVGIIVAIAAASNGNGSTVTPTPAPPATTT